MAMATAARAKTVMIVNCILNDGGVYVCCWFFCLFEKEKMKDKRSD
jgi:hypothetical protein